MQTADGMHEHDLVIAQLQEEFPTVTLDVIRLEVQTAAAEFTHARIRGFVPVLVQHKVKDRLRAHTRPAVADDQAQRRTSP